MMNSCMIQDVGSTRFNLSDGFIDIGLTSSNDFEHDFSVPVDDLESRHGGNVVFGGNISINVNVDLDKVDSMLLALSMDIGSDVLAGAAPSGVEVHKASVSFLEQCVEFSGGVGVVGHLKISYK